MTAVMFDALKYANKLKAAGVNDKQAEVQAEALAEIVDERLATKQDLKELELNLKREIASMKLDIVRWFIGSLMALLGIMFAMIKLS
ncbi:MAG: DUF1640 domain-containing protein [Methylococcales bacterium]|jgi:hypothetical protein|nr:DUF1640 domain-containing protein [Methylococcales bacterium]MBT7411238.1 DUF1640 domain-containing protein [Methylococcales bacterium]